MMEENNIYIWNVTVDNIVISKFVEPKTNSEYLIIYLDKVTDSLVSANA